MGIKNETKTLTLGNTSGSAIFGLPEGLFSYRNGRDHRSPPFLYLTKPLAGRTAQNKADADDADRITPFAMGYALSHPTVHYKRR